MNCLKKILKINPEIDPQNGFQIDPEVTPKCPHIDPQNDPQKDPLNKESLMMRLLFFNDQQMVKMGSYKENNNKYKGFN